MSLFRSVVNVVSIVMTGLAAILLLAFTAAPTVFGYKSYVVLSGSMEPAILTGAVVVAQPVPPTSLKVGDVIVYNRSDVDERITHRIVEVNKADSGKPTFDTMGYANSVPDSWTVQYATGTAGKVLFSVPYVGYISAALESPQGRMLFIIIPVVVLSGMWLWQIWRPNKPSEVAPLPAASEAKPAEVPRAARFQPVNLKSNSSEGPGLPLRR